MYSGNHFSPSVLGSPLGLFSYTLLFWLPLYWWLKQFPLYRHGFLNLQSCSLFMPSELPLAPQESCAQTTLVFFFPEFMCLFLMALTFSNYLDAESWIWIHLWLFPLPTVTAKHFLSLGESSFSQCLLELAYPYIHS